jgi:transposase
MFQHLSSDNSQSPNIATLLDKLASQPNGLENGLKLAMLLTPKPDAQPTLEAANRKRLIAIALQLVKNEDIENPPYFKGMSDDAIRDFIAQYSPELVLN